MNWIIRILLIVVISLVGYGFSIKSYESPEGDKWIGVGILILALVLMPLFIYHRYKNKNINDYVFDLNKFKNKDTDNQ
ncbi:hypothetical protein [Flavobacterium sp.]|uniref:hypothetical protein n=1 Tax=Flavobacterium sp. TaxID=239 RepID=UPI00404740D0